MKEQLHISFRELRTKLEEALNFIKELSGEDIITSKTCIEKDIGISGLDADEFLLEIQQEFDVNFDKFEFNKYFHEEGIELIYYPLIPFQLVIFIFQLFVLLVRKIFNLKFLNKFIYFNIFMEIDKLRGIHKEELTVGDIVISMLYKEFKLRNDVEINLI